MNRRLQHLRLLLDISSLSSRLIGQSMALKTICSICILV